MGTEVANSKELATSGLYAYPLPGQVCITVDMQYVFLMIGAFWEESLYKKS